MVWAGISLPSIGLEAVVRFQWRTMQKKSLLYYWEKRKQDFFFLFSFFFPYFLLFFVIERVKRSLIKKLYKLWRVLRISKLKDITMIVTLSWAWPNLSLKGTWEHRQRNKCKKITIITIYNPKRISGSRSVYFLLSLRVRSGYIIFKKCCRKIRSSHGQATVDRRKLTFNLQS